MFFANWRRRRRRELFRYWDGGRQRRIDPLQAFRAIHADPEFRADVHPELAEDGDQDAVDIILRMTRRVFDVAEFTEDYRGLTESEQMLLYLSFCGYVEHLKKKFSLWRTPPESTEPTSGESKSETTNSSSASSSTSPASN